jgi:hypothetical protein
MRFKIFIAFLALATSALLPINGGSALAGEPQAQKQELQTGAIGGNVRTKEENLVTCMALWEPATHMTKELWRAVCKRLETRN